MVWRCIQRWTSISSPFVIGLWRMVSIGMIRAIHGTSRPHTSTAPEDLIEELNTAGFGTIRVFGVEGPGWLLADFEARWADPASREDILRVARLLEEEPSILGASAHLLAVGHRAVDRRSA